MDDDVREATDHFGTRPFARCDCPRWYWADPLPRRAPCPDGHTIVYLFFGFLPWEWGVSSNTLLYVGVTEWPVTRWETHRREKPWWRDVVLIQTRLCFTRDAALRHESDLIEACDPLYNRTGPHHARREEQRFRNRERLPRALANLSRRWALPT